MLPRGHPAENTEIAEEKRNENFLCVLSVLRVSAVFPVSLSLVIKEGIHG
jgi:hypothetical protein